MLLVERYRALYEYEKECNRKILAMLESISEDGRRESRFQQAVTLADHLAAGREKWLEYIIGKGNSETLWWNERCDLSTLPPRFAALEYQWTDYLARLEDSQLAQEFEFTESNGECFRVPIGVQIEQLVGHAAYHRGQIALLVTQLGGETPDTDYVDWCWATYREQEKHSL